MKIELQIACENPNIPTKKQFQNWLNIAAENISQKIPRKQQNLTICIVDKTESQKLNKQYRKKDYPTNVLSFEPTDIPGFTRDTLGDLAICADVVEAEALEQHKTTEAHWAHMSIHGFLHLLGYDHENETDAVTMETLETKILQQLGFSDPYI